MIYTTENNWYTWQYGNKEPMGRQNSEHLLLNFNYSRYDKPVLSFKEELDNAARSTLDHYPGLVPCIFFSGGVDSELIVRSYFNIGSNPKIYIVRFDNDYNLYDVSYAITICNMMKWDYTLIDFNLTKFYENDALTVAEQAQIDRPGMLPHLKFTESVDGLIIVGHSDVRYFRQHDDYSMPSVWLAQDFEHDIGCDKYNIYHNRPAIYQWFKWSPGLVLSYTKLNWFKRLVNDEIIGKTGINSTKIEGFRELYPDMIQREKQTGIEKIDHIYNKILEQLKLKFNGLPYRQEYIRSIDDMWVEITGNTYLNS